jgi:iron complex outermembrane receptor protein
VKPEVLDDYEVGLKNEFLDRKVRLNVDGFFYNYKDIQLERIINGPFVTVNAAAAHIYGAEAELDTAVTSHFTIQGGFSYLHGRYTSFPNAPISSPNPAGGNNSVDGDATGNVIIHTPKFKTNIGGTYKMDTLIRTGAACDIRHHI